MGEIDTQAKRAKLAPRKNPYWAGIAGGRGGVSLGYRKGAKGPGSWIAKMVVDRCRLEERLGEADDKGAAPGALGYKEAVSAAIEWSARQHATLDDRQSSAAAYKVPTVSSAVEAYATSRLRRSAAGSLNARGRLAKHVLSDTQFAETPMKKLNAETLLRWRERLASKDAVPSDAQRKTRLAPATVNRLLNDLRAALNASYETNRRSLPANLPAEIRIGTRAERVPEPARQQLLSDAMVRAAIDAAFEIEEDGHFGRLVLLAAATGARYSQLAEMRVGHVQKALGRVLVPGSRKGRAARVKPPVAVPLSQAVLDRLAPAYEGRNPEAPLLMRWAFRRAQNLRWERDQLRPLAHAYEALKQWAEVVERAGLPDGTIMYAFRHTSVVRGLRAGLPVRLVASLHDTSTEMIESHYAAFIVDMTEDLARGAALSFEESGAVKPKEEMANEV